MKENQLGAIENQKFRNKVEKNQQEAKTVNSEGLELKATIQKSLVKNKKNSSKLRDL